MLARVLETLGRTVARHPWWTILTWVVVAATCAGLAVTGLGGASLFDRLSTGQPTVPGSESERAGEILSSVESGESFTLALSGIDPASPAVVGVLEAARADLAAIDGVAQVIDPHVLPGGLDNPAAAPLLADSGDGMLVVATLETGRTEDAHAATVDAVLRRLGAVPEAMVAAGQTAASGTVGGGSLIFAEITDQVKADLVTGETIALPVALLLMVLVFGGFLAASLPLVGAVASIGVALGALLGLSYVMDLDTSVVNVVTVLGLGLSIDYGLLVVSRFRDELTALLADDDGASTRRRRGDGAVQRALATTMATAGRTIVFSAAIVAIAVAGLLIFTPTVLRAISAGGVAIILVALLASVTLVPALLALLGRRLARPGLASRLPGLRELLRRTGDAGSDTGTFSRLAQWVQRRPWAVLAGCLVVLATLSLPVLHLELRNTGIEQLPADSTQRDFVEEVAAEYPASTSPAIRVVAQTTLAQAQSWTAGLSALDDVAGVDEAAPVDSYVVLGVRPDSDDAGGATARHVVDQIRALDPGFEFWVTGQAANQTDFLDAMVDRVWYVVGLVALATFVLLFLMTGSVIIPVKALLISALSLGASVGVLVWVFQDGNLSGLLGFTPVGGIETYVLALVLAFGFGLAMDYEVFLLSRIKEAHDAGASNDESVRLGLQRSGRIITSAAAIIIVVFLGFVAGELLVIKEVGFALAVTVLIDATLVRMLLVPAAMTLLGRANWWAPRVMRPLAARFSLSH